ncbi:MAG TPA: 2-phospho-L-lactate guanylyltransferase [Actinomycetota bacterium]|jgi:2-phospho-L-lactate guanylyltransferase|nr:2-phospho-L-lactate guanylyltransferase [Actinomycetota bacterium]
MKVVAIPVKSLERAKSRLSPVLSRLERGALTLAMLEDLLDQTLAIPGWDTWVISPDEVVLEISSRRGARPVAEEKPSLSGAVRQVESLAMEREVSSFAILPGDLPLVSAPRLTEALRTLGPVVLAPTRDGSGTSLLLRRPPRAIPSRFGADSFRRHRALAEERGLPVAVVQVSELSFDLDLPDDILTLLGSDRRGRTREVCEQMGLGERLGAHA